MERDAGIACERHATRYGAGEIGLEQARTVGDGGLSCARNDSMLDPLRSEPRFARLLPGMGFDGGTA